MVKVKLVEPLSGMLAAPNALMMTGGATTVTLAFEVLPVPPSVEVTCTLLFFAPAVVPVTFTDNVQEVLMAKVPADKLTVPDPATAVAVPPQVLVSPLGVATTKPASRLSVKATPVNPMVLIAGLVMVKVKLVEPFSGIVAAPKALVIVGGVATVMLADAVFPVPPLVEITFPVVLFFTPEVVPVTLTVSVQLLLTAIVPPASDTLPEPATAVAAPPQVLVSPLGVATTRPAGSVSVNATPVSATALPAGLVMVKVSEVVPFSGRFAAPKALAIDGGATTLMLADAVPPVPPSVDVTFPVVLFCVPAAVPVTFTANVQEVLCARLAPLRLITFVACVAVMVPPPQLPVKPFGVETTRPAGKVSLKPTPVSAVPVLLFWIVKVRLVEPFNGMLAAPKALMITGGATTVTLALEVLPVPPSVDVTCTLLFFALAVVPVTFTDNVHEALTATVPPDRLTDPEPATAVAVPPQVLDSPFGVATTRPAGRLSVKATPVSATLAFGFVMVKVNEVDPFNGIVAAPNALVIVGGATTVMLAEAVLPVPPLVEVTFPVVLFFTPAVVPVTFAVSVQLLLTAMVPPVREMLPEPATAVAVPPQVLVNPLGVATTNPAGSVSVNATPVSATALPPGLVIVKVSEVVPFSGRFAAPKALAIDGGATTLMLADAVPPVPPSVDVTLPVVLFCVPAAVPVTFTAKVQEVLCARLAPLRLITFVACVAVIVPPPQLPVRPFGVETTRPAGKVSLKPTPVSVVPVLLF